MINAPLTLLKVFPVVSHIIVNSMCEVSPVSV